MMTIYIFQYDDDDDDDDDDIPGYVVGKVDDLLLHRVEAQHLHCIV